jgi:ABC-2 type transport system permease protein
LKRVINITKAVLKNWTRSKQVVFFSLLFPIILLGIFGSIFSGTGSSSFGIYVQNLDVGPGDIPAPLSTSFVGALNSTKIITVTGIIPTNVSDPVSYIKEKLGYFSGTPRLLIIPAGFSYSLLNATADSIHTTGIGAPQMPVGSATITLVLDPGATSTPEVRNILESFTQSYSLAMMGAAPLVYVQNEAFTSQTFKAVEYYLPGIIGAFIMTNGITVLASNTVDLKRRGVLKRLAQTPLTRLEWVMGNVAAQTVLNFMLTAVMIAAGYVLFQITIVPNLLGIALIFAGSVAFSGIGMMIAGALGDMESVGAITNGIAFPMMFLSGSFTLLEVMPAYMQTLSKLLPLTYLSDGLRSALVTGDAACATVDLLIVVVIGAAVIAVGAKMTRWGSG